MESVSGEEGDLSLSLSSLEQIRYILDLYTVSKNRLSMALAYISLSLSSSFLRVSFYLFPSFATFGVTAAVLKIGVRWFGNVHRCFCTATITRACARINRCKRLSYWINLIFPFVRDRCSTAFGSYDDDEERVRTIGKSVLIRFVPIVVVWNTK